MDKRQQIFWLVTPKVLVISVIPLYNLYYESNQGPATATQRLKLSTVFVRLGHRLFVSLQLTLKYVSIYFIMWVSMEKICFV
jgi:hypothetical protein